MSLYPHLYSVLASNPSSPLSLPLFYSTRSLFPCTSITKTILLPPRRVLLYPLHTKAPLFPPLPQALKCMYPFFFILSIYFHNSIFLWWVLKCRPNRNAGPKDPWRVHIYRILTCCYVSNLSFASTFPLFLNLYCSCFRLVMFLPSLFLLLLFLTSSGSTSSYRFLYSLLPSFRLLQQLSIQTPLF